MSDNLLALAFILCAIIGLSIAVVVQIISISIKWMTERYKYVQLVEALPGPKAYPLIGTMYMFFGAERQDVPRILRKNRNIFPYISRSWLGPRANIELKRAEHIEIILNSSKQHLTKSWTYRFLHPWLGEGLLTSDGEKWHSHRKIITPSFHFSILESFCEVFSEKSKILLEKLSPHAESSEPVDIYPYITKAALDIIADAAMGTPVNAQDDRENEYVNAIYEMSELILRRLLRPWVHPDIIYKYTEDGRSFQKCIKILHNFTENVIRQRKLLRQTEKLSNKDNNMAAKKQRLAFLDVLLETSENGNYELSDTDLREEVDTFMFEGHDTTTAGMAWALLLLGLHPKIQEDVYNELNEIFKGSTRSATIHDFSEMKLLERVIKETLRLYPPVPNISRELTENVQIDQYTLPAGCTVGIEIAHLHRDERFFPDAERFEPDRFLSENVTGRHPYAYVPFSAGPRNCIGQKFAMYEEKSVLSTIIRNYRFKTVGQRNDVQEVYELIYRPINGIWLTLEKRNCKL